MTPIQHHTATRVLGAPKDWDQQVLPCNAIAITDVESEGIPSVLTYWRPSLDDLVNLANGGYVCLSVVGRTMAPCHIFTEPK